MKINNEQQLFDLFNNPFDKEVYIFVNSSWSEPQFKLSPIVEEYWSHFYEIDLFETPELSELLSGLINRTINRAPALITIWPENGVIRSKLVDIPMAIRKRLNWIENQLKEYEQVNYDEVEIYSCK